MKRKRRVLQVLLVALIGVLVAVLWRPAQIQFHLYLFRDDEASARVAMQSACALGPSVREPLIDAIYAHASDPDIGFFRPAAFLTLACLRRAAVYEHPGNFLPPDYEAIDAMHEVYEGASSPAHRRAMAEVFNRLDEWTYLLLWQRLEEERRPAYRLMPRVCPTPCGTDLARTRRPDYQNDWCAHVGPVVRRWLIDGEAGVDDYGLVQHLSDHRCLGDVSALLAAIQARKRQLSDRVLEEFLTGAYVAPESQSQVLTSLTQFTTDCAWQRALHRGLEIRRPHTDGTKAVLRAWTMTMEEACLAELFADVPPAERGPQMLRSLGVSSD